MTSPRLALLVALTLAPFAGCKCHEPPLKPVDACKGVPGVQAEQYAACSSSAECGDHYGCKEVKDRDGLQCCVLDDRRCNTEADCCPGQTCPADRKKCFDKYLTCETDADCGDKGDRYCELYTDTYGTSKRCRFHACSPLGECPDGQSCFKGECMADLPCGGSCEPGKACVPSVDRCQDYSEPTGRPQAACPVSCAPGFLATFKDNRNLWDSCSLPDVACECGELPPLRSGDVGRFSALAVDATRQALFASAYDGQYGDLLVYRFDAAGKLARLDYVDGVPSGTTTYGPSGPRKGVIEPGDDVGRYTDVAVHGDTVYVSYYDVTNGDLKLAYRKGDGEWTAVRVDGLTADVGLYTSLALDAAGLPVISYFQRGGNADFNAATCPSPAPTGAKAFITSLKLARATSATPGPNDFAVKTVACQSRPPPPCHGCTQTCADPGTGPSCYLADATCTGCAADTETCVKVGTTAKCAKKYNPANLSEVPEGVGLFSALAVNGKDAYIVYMRRTAKVPAGGTKPIPDGDLFGVKVSAAGVVSTPVLLDDDGDTGFFPDLKLDPSSGALAISYHDVSSKQLKYIAASALAPNPTVEVIDPGTGAAGAGESSWVGADSALVFGAKPGQLFALYQDATRGDLKLAARKSGGGWERLAPLRTEGAVGFFADGVVLGNQLFASHAHLHAKLVSGEPRVNNKLLLEQFTTP